LGSSERLPSNKKQARPRGGSELRLGDALSGRPARETVWSAAHPRLKVALTILFILVGNLMTPGDWPAHALAALLLWTTAVLAHVSLRHLFARSLLALPFVLAALPLPFTYPGHIIASLPVLDWPISQEGIVRLATVLIRSWLSVQAAALLVATTSFPAILWGLQGLHVPRLIIAVISLMYRYLSVMGEEAQSLLRARAARSAVLPGGHRPRLLWRAQITGNLVGSLFIRSLERSERVYAAMLARGYTGEVRLLASSTWRSSDSLLALVAVVALASVLLVGVLF
jgi:cobalt/nickel transport system permease protein